MNENNKHIELVKKWLDDNDSVSLKELKENRRAAHINVIATYDAANEADTDVAWTDAWAAEYAFEASEFALEAAKYASEAADAADVVNYWVTRYEELTTDLEEEA